MSSSAQNSTRPPPSRRSSRLRAAPVPSSSSSSDAPPRALASSPMHRGAGTSSSSSEGTGSTGETSSTGGKNTVAGVGGVAEDITLMELDVTPASDKGKAVARDQPGSSSSEAGMMSRLAIGSGKDTSASLPSSATPPLPSLLSHLSLAPAFLPAPSTSTSVAAGTFTFPASTFSSRHLYPHHLLHPPSHKRSHSPSTRPDKRSAPSPHPHLFARTKKIKTAHRFFRDEALLAGPQFSTPASSRSRTNTLTSQSSTGTNSGSLASPLGTSPPSPSSDKLSWPPLPPLLPLAQSSARTKPYTPPPTRKSPTWWASASRSSGDGRPSRMAPRESKWCGGGDGWAFPWTTSRKSEAGEVQEPEALKGVQTPEPGAASMKRVTRTERSLSSPPAFLNPSVLIRLPPDQAQQAAQIRALSVHPQGITQLGAPPLKQHLLAVLRMRLAEGGGSSRGSEAGLRFKKWVALNSYYKRTSLDASSPSSLETESDGNDSIDISDELVPFQKADQTPLPSAEPIFAQVDSSSPPAIVRDTDMPALLLPPDLEAIVQLEDKTTDALVEPDTPVLPEWSQFTVLDDQVGVARPVLRRSQSLPSGTTTEAAPTNEWERVELDRQLAMCEA